MDKCYDPHIPGYERYEMRVDHSRSQYTLLVHEASLDDEAEFQCQSFILTTRIRLSSSGCASEIRPNGQVAGGRLDSFMKTKSPTWRFSSCFLYIVL
ncbi:hypothetical protein CDAR_295531 [Caerostris darwini]|uniref:Uncharacterized protein n=1 Tax=Caerostris darwini TaxID=1538125 RepID=A0AAV4NDS8_9ARAC|nr:hypothetical protein CDAR_295531 [Caerostris darwini]